MSLSHWATWSGFYTALSGRDLHMYVFFLFVFYLLYSFLCPSFIFVFVLYLYCTESAYKLSNKCAQVSFFSRLITFLVLYLTCKLTNRRPEMGKVFGFIWLREYNTSEWGPVIEPALWLLLVRGAARLPLPHHRAVWYLFGWFKRLSSRTLRLYKNT